MPALLKRPGAECRVQHLGYRISHPGQLEAGLVEVVSVLRQLFREDATYIRIERRGYTETRIEVSEWGD